MSDQKIIAFTGVRLAFGWLSNMSPHPVNHLGHLWRTSEHLFQALRFDDEAIRDLIRAEPNPMKAKMLAKSRQTLMTIVPRTEQDIENMKTCLELKLVSNAGDQNLLEELLATRDAILIEDVTARPVSPSNDFWGMRLIDEDGVPTWNGENKLGSLWMELREEKRQQMEMRIPGV